MKLLNRTLRLYLLYSALVLLVSIPVFYVVIQRLFTEEIDEVLWLRKEAIQASLARFPDEEALLSWRDLEGNTQLRPVDTRPPRPDQIVDRAYREHPENPRSKPEPFRELTATLTFQGHPYQLITRTSLVEQDDLLQAIMLTLAGLLGGLLLGLLWLNRQTARHLWQPFYDTLAQLRQYRVDANQPLRLLPSSTTEFAELNQALNELTRRSQQTFADQKEFTENAAHEMQTPVAIFQTKLERLGQTQPLTDEQTELLGSLNGVTARLARLNKSLLLLARIDNQPPGSAEPVRVADVLNSLIAQSDETITAKQIELIQTGFETGSTLKTNRTLLETLLSNLLTNAIRYTPAKGQITIHVQPESVLIANTGEPLTLTKTQLFARFGKGEAQTGGVGLGLAIAKKIADVCGYSLTYHYADGQHQFTVRFA